MDRYSEDPMVTVDPDLQMDMDDTSDNDFEIYTIKVHELVDALKYKNYEIYC